MNWDDHQRQYDSMMARLREGGGPARAARQKRLGRLLARERIEALVDKDSFFEWGGLQTHKLSHLNNALANNVHPSDGVITGTAKIHSTPVAIYAHDITILRGSAGQMGTRKIVKLLEHALRERLPVIALMESDGARIEEALHSVEPLGDYMAATIALQGKVPQISLVCGVTVGGIAYNAAMTDFVGMIRGQSYLFITGPTVTEAVTGEKVDIESLGGTEVHLRKTGLCDAALANEVEGLAWVKKTLDLCVKKKAPPCLPSETRALESIVPSQQRRAYDMHKVLKALFDGDSMVELMPEFAKNCVTMLARLNGRTMGVVANNPLVIAGSIDVLASRKIARAVRKFTRLGIPIVTLVDTPGYLPGTKQEQDGILPIGSEVLEAYFAAQHLPRISVVLRKSYGGASVLSYAGRIRIGLPTAQVSPVSPELVKRVTGEAISEPTGFDAAADGYLDCVVMPNDLRTTLIQTLDSLNPEP